MAEAPLPEPIIEREMNAEAPEPPGRVTACEREIETLVRARYPLLYVVSWEEDRVMRALDRIGGRCGKRIVQWTVTGGLARYRGNVRGAPEGKKGTKDPALALREIEMTKEEPTIFVLKDFHHFMKEVAITRGLRDLAGAMRDTFSTLVILSPVLVIVPELDKEMTVVDFPLPDREELGDLLEQIAEEVKDNKSLAIDAGGESRRMLLEAAVGLTLHEAENVFAKVLLRRGRLAADVAEEIYEEKQQIVRKSGLLEYIQTRESIGDIGGLELMKDWLARRKGAFHPAAREMGLPIPKGLLLVGVQGCGKSLAAKAVSRAWQMPLLRMDMGQLFGSLVGASEQNIRQAIKLAEAIAPAILWIDEMDKGFAGLSSSGASDGGTASRVFATLITWMQEKKSAVFVIATANNVERLPPELLRQGRFDEIFFVDLPTARERADIFRIHLVKRLRNLFESKVKPGGKFASVEDFVAAHFNVEELAQAAEQKSADGRTRYGFSGAEIEQAIVTALYNAFFEKKAPSQKMVLEAIAQTSPLSRVMAGDIESRRAWARDRARKASRGEAAGPAA